MKHLASLTLSIVTTLIFTSCFTSQTKKTSDEAKANSHYQLGIAVFSQGDTTKAKRQLGIAIEYAPEIPYYHNHLGLVYIRENNFEKAKECFEKSFSLDKSYSDPLNNLGVLYLKTGNIPKAKELFFRVLSDQLYPNPHFIETNIGVTARIEKNYTEAINRFEKAIRIKGTYCEAYKELALTYDDINEPDKALENYKNAVKYCPYFVEALYRGAVKLLVKKDDFNGKQFLQRCIDIEMNNSSAVDIPFLRECTTLAKQYGITVKEQKIDAKKQIESN